MADPSDDPARGAGAPAFAALGLRTGDPDTLERIRGALVCRGLSDPYPPGHVPSEAFGAYSTFLVLPGGLAVIATDETPEEILSLARIAYSMGATQVSVWSEEVDRVLDR